MNLKQQVSCLLFLAATIAWIWLAMLLTHELGHVLAAILTGGTITSIELRPGRLPHTLVNPNPRPSVVLWSGFLVGWIGPQLTAPLWKIERGLIGPVLRAGTAFCLLAGGVYLAAGGLERLTDTGQLVLHGWPLPLLIAVGVGVAALGYVRSRSAWIDLAKRLESLDAPLSADWRLAIAWWAWLAV